jgi:hypothetical protein
VHMRSFSNLSAHALLVIEDRSASRMKSGKMQAPDARGSGITSEHLVQEQTG